MMKTLVTLCHAILDAPKFAEQISGAMSIHLRK
jgi:hypothetical protein